MKSRRLVVLTQEPFYDFIAGHLPGAELVSNLPEGSGSYLVGFSTGVIVPEDVLLNWETAINFHGAPPTYPGRDPHHWACYDEAPVYGATAHLMHSQVDAGPIFGQLVLGSAHARTPAEYQALGQSALMSLFAAWCAHPESAASEIDAGWSGQKRARKDLIEMCDMRELTPNERERRKIAFQGFEKYFIE